QLADGLTSLEDVIPTIEALGNTTDSEALREFFGAFADIDPGSGASLQSLSDTLRGFDAEFIKTLKRINGLKPSEKDDNALSKFFRAFNDVDPEAGDKLKSLVDTLRGFDAEFIETLKRINGLQLSEGDDNVLSKFFRAFNKVDPEAGSKLKSLVDT